MTRLCSQTVAAIQYILESYMICTKLLANSPLSFKRKTGMLHCNQTQLVGERYTGHTPLDSQLLPLSGPLQ